VHPFFLRDNFERAGSERHWVSHDQRTLNFWSKPVVAHLNLARVVDGFYCSLYRYALSLTDSEADAADLTRQTFFSLLQRLDQIRDVSQIKCWLFATLRREFFKTARYQMRYREVEFKPDCHDEAAPDLNALRGLDTEAVLKALNRLSETHRPVLQLFYLGELSYKEIASALEIPIGTVMSQLARGREELRARLMAASREVS
jgi:RNA polymerase sigma-70 factor (ECF subfamily)